jgi:sec-independent protein translocase protein TatA
MGDVAQGIKAFKKGMSEDETLASAAGNKPDAVKSINHDNAATSMKARSETENRAEGSTA